MTWRELANEITRMTDEQKDKLAVVEIDNDCVPIACLTTLTEFGGDGETDDGDSFLEIEA